LEAWRKVKNESPLDPRIQTRDDAVRLVLGTPFSEGELEKITQPEIEDMVRNCRLGPEDIVLEIGCGVGRFATLLSPLVKEYHGVDLSAQMVRVGRERTAGLDNVYFEQCNGRDLSLYEEGRFTFVFCTIAFIHMDVEDVFGYLLEANRCLVKGGRAYFDFLNLWDDRVRDKWLAAYTLPRDSMTMEKDPYRTRFLSPGSVRQYVIEAGFQIDRMVLDILTRVYCVKDADRPYVGFFRDEAEKHREQLLRTLTEDLARIRGSRAYKTARWLSRLKGLFSKNTLER